MPTYQTRHLEALKEFPHGQRSLKTGEPFTASEVDAEYYKLHKMAKEVAPEAEQAGASKATVQTQRAPVTSPAAEPRARKTPAPAAPSGVVTLADVNPDAPPAASATRASDARADATDASKARPGDA